MALPKRNIALRILYGIAILGMFGFLFWQSLPFDADGKNLFSDERPSVTGSSTTEQLIDTVEKRYETVKLYTRKVGGITRTLDLSTHLNSQIDQHWLDFANSPLATDLPLHNQQVYAVYHHYDSQRSTVQLTLGFIHAGNRQYPSVVTLAAGRYLKLPRIGVLEGWQQAETLPGTLRLQTDYEIYQLDPDFQPASQITFLALK